MDLNTIIHILAGSTFGLSLRLFIKYKVRKQLGFNFDSSSIVNVLSSLFLGNLVALNLANTNLLLFFYIGFLGCFSTFSSFIYHLFNLIQDRQYLRLLIYYIKVLILSFLSFCIGNYITLIFKHWIKKTG